MRFICTIFCIMVTIAGSAKAGNSYVLPDGISRSTAVTLHCATSASTALPCGTQAVPLVVSAAAGGATASNQSTEITAQQGMLLALGSQADQSYIGGSGTMIALLKGLVAALTSGVPAVPVGGLPASRSLSVSSQTSTALFPANVGRRYLAFQAPQTSGVWVNLLGGTATPNGVDCAYFAAGSFYESGSYVNRSAIMVYSAVPVTISAWEG